MKLKRIHSDKPWGRALERLRVCNEREIPINTFEKQGVMKRVQYRAILRSKQGPRIATLNRLLSAMNCTLRDWAKAYESIENEQEDSLSDYE